MSPSVSPRVCGRRNTPLSPTAKETFLAISGPIACPPWVTSNRPGMALLGEFELVIDEARGLSASVRTSPVC